MKENKGFTLIELLAVIVILAVIALIATPIIIGIIENAREKAYENSAYGIISSTQNYYASGLLKPENGIKYNENVIDELHYSGEKPKEGSIAGINKEGQTAVALLYGKYCFVKEYEEYRVRKGDPNNCTVDLIINNTLGGKIRNSPIVTSGSGVYKDGEEYRYRGGCDIQGSSGNYSCNGADPVNNYISINGQKYRIIVLDSQGVKVQTPRKLVTDRAFDEGDGSRNNANNTFCQGYAYCNVYAAVSENFVAGNKSGTVTQNSSLYDYLNSTGTDTELVTLRNKAKSATWNIGSVIGDITIDSISTVKSQEARNTATFKMGLMNVSDYIQGSIDSGCRANFLNDSMRNQQCRNNNWLYDKDSNYPWTINPWTDTAGNSEYVWCVYTSEGYMCHSWAFNTNGVRPAAYLDASTIVTAGTGTEADPWVIE